MDGKLVFGQATGDESTMDVDAEGGGSGVNAYVAALEGKDAPKKGLHGKFKWSNKKSHGGGDSDDDMELDAESTAVTKTKVGDGKRGEARIRGAGSVRGGKRAGRGGIPTGRRGLGEEKWRGASMKGRVGKSRRGRR